MPIQEVGTLCRQTAISGKLMRNLQQVTNLMFI